MPTFDCDLETYYDGIDATSTPIETFKELISDHYVIWYSNTWDALKSIDEDDDDSNNVKLIYSRRSESKSSSSWNREHVWPRSYGVGNTGPDYSDLHHLFPSDQDVNSARSSKIFAECRTEDNCESPAHPEASPDTATNSYIFTPPSVVKGDIARALMYVALRYNGPAQEADTENLTMSECPCGYAFTSPGELSTLLEWHKQDPVDDTERTRNDRVCSYQGNRNPFVDMPSLVDRFYGGVCTPTSCPYCQSSATFIDTFNCTDVTNADNIDDLIEKYGIIAGGGVLVLVLVLAIFCCICCRTKK